MDALNRIHGRELTASYTPLGTVTASTVTVLKVEAVGALDPFADITFSIEEVGFADAAGIFVGLDPDEPSGGDEILFDGSTWTVVKIRRNSLVYELRALKAETVI